MNRFVIAITIMALFLSCDNTDKSKTSVVTDSTKKTGDSPAAIHYLEKDADSMVIPSFSIEVKLSGKAVEQLTGQNETIIVSALFSGQPKDTSTREYAESGEMFVQSAQVELSNNSRVAKFDGVKFPKQRYDSLAGKDISLLINIFSGRKSSPYNLLDCAILSEKMSVVKGQQFPLACKLIGETDSLQSK